MISSKSKFSPRGQSEAAKAQGQAPQKLLDEFEAYDVVFLENKRHRRREKLYVGAVLLFACGFLLAGMKPPVVIVKDNLPEPAAPRILAQGEQPEVRQVDAESFFLYAVKRRWGWDSATVMRDLEEVNLMLTPQMRTAFQAHVNGVVEQEQEQGGIARTPVQRVTQWMQATVRNNVKLGRDRIQCKKGDAEETWYCHGTGYIETSPLFEEMEQALTERRKVEFRAKIYPFRYTQATPWGMIIGYLDAVDMSEEG